MPFTGGVMPLIGRGDALHGRGITLPLQAIALPAEGHHPSVASDWAFLYGISGAEATLAQMHRRSRVYARDKLMCGIN
jgi:hypothetical protein